jgi:hypothetical protein
MANRAGGVHGLPVVNVFREMERDYREQVVGRALSHLETVSGERRGEFLTLVRDKVKGVRGFQDASKAPAALLKQPISHASLSANELASGVLNLWLGSHDRLKTLTETHLESAGISIEYLDLAECRFRGTWSSATLLREKGKFGRQHPEFDGSDIGLMLCCVSGNALDGLQDAGALARGPSSRALAEALEYLKTLPVVAQEWDQEVPDFIRLASQIREGIEAERSLALSLDVSLSSIKDRFGEFLQFFECDGDAWSAANLLPGSRVRALDEMAASLETLLTEYQDVHWPAPVVTEERGRAERRADLQARILETVESIQLAMSPQGATLVAGPVAAPGIDSQDFPAGGMPETPGDAAQPPTDIPVPIDSTPASTGVSREDFESVQSLVHGLQQQNEHMQQEVKRLEGKLYESQQQEESWRIAYVTYDESQRGIEDDIEGDALGMDDVAKAVALAEQRFAGRLLFQLNSESSVEDNPFERPGQVWRALQWLATTYYEARTGEVTVTDFDLSVRKACGWWYKGSQGQSTLTTYRNSYTTKNRGKTYWLEEHIGKGTNRDARYTIRIAFDWDRDLKVVVVGYIGRHQQTDIS